MIKKNIFKIGLVLGVLVPVVSFAALQGIKDIVIALKDIINLTIPVVFGLAIIYFFWGMANFILHSDDEKVREQGKQKMLWGIIALFVIVSIYGIFTFISDSTGIKMNGSASSGNGTCIGGFDPVDGSACN